jgi:hypothetical protein
MYLETNARGCELQEVNFLVGKGFGFSSFVTFGCELHAFNFAHQIFPVGIPPEGFNKHYVLSLGVIGKFPEWLTV